MIGNVLAYILIIGMDFLIVSLIVYFILVFIDVVIEKIKKGKQEIKKTEQENGLQILREKVEIYENKDGCALTYKNPPIPVNCCKSLTKEQYEILKELGFKGED